MLAPLTSAPDSTAPASDRIARPELTRRLGAALDRGPLLLVAPAGSGKTIALEQALAERGGATAWVKCRPEDADAGRLLDHLLATLGASAPGVSDVLRERLATAVAPVDPGAATADLVGELERLLVDPLTIVFDDAEQLGGGEGPTALIRGLIDARAEPLRVAIASRQALPLRLAKLRAAGGVTELAAADLAFSAGDCEELLRARRGRDVSDGEVESLMEATEGWPLGIALNSRQAVAGAAAPGSQAELWAFLDEEVLGPMDTGFRSRLLASALAPELNARTVAGLDLGEDFLAEAAERDVFLRPVPGTDSLAYHPLFREYLLDRLESDAGEEELARLHAGMAEALSDERPLEAVEHWLAAGREPEAVKLIGRHSQPLVRSSHAVVRDWIDRLSPESRGEPAIALLEGQLAMGVGRHVQSVELLREAGAEWERRGSRAMWTARFSEAQSLIVLGRFDEVAALTEGFDDDSTANVVAAPMVALWAAIAIGGTGKRAEGRELLDRGRAHPLGALLEPVDIAYEAYYVAWHEGRLDDAADGAARAIARMEEFDPVRWMPFTLWYAAYVHEARGEEDEAVRLLERSREMTREYGIGEYPAAVASAMKAGFDARAGREAEAELELTRAEPHLGSSWHGYDAELARAELAARRGDRPNALAAADRARDLVSRGYLGEHLRASCLLAHLYERLGDPARGAEAIEGAIAAATPGTDVSRQLALRAWLREGEGDPAASGQLVEAWNAAGDGAVHLVRREWPRIERLTWEALEAGELEPAPVVRALREGIPGGEPVIALLDHPAPAVRREAATALATSGHPAAPRRLDELAGDADPDVAATAKRAASRLRRDLPPLSLTLFGAFELRRGGRLVEDDAWERRIAERLVRMLAIQPQGQAVPEDLIFEAFWPDRDAKSARRSLQVAVSCARGVLDPPGAEESALEAHERSYRLGLRPVDSVDTAVFATAARAALESGGAERPALLRRAAALWGGDPLPEERYETWTAAWREGLIDLHSEVLGALAEASLAAGDPMAATGAARRLVELDPLSETAHRLLMVSFARSGRRGHALRQFLDCRRALVGELGVDPSAETVELHRAVLAGEPV